MLYPDRHRLKALVQSGEILDEVEKAIRSLELRDWCREYDFAADGTPRSIRCFVGREVAIERR